MKIQDMIDFLNGLPEDLKDTAIYLQHHPAEPITENWGRHEHEDLIFFDKEVLRLLAEWRERRQSAWIREVCSAKSASDTDRWLKNARKAGVLD